MAGQETTAPTTPVAAAADNTRATVAAIVAELPFEDDPTTFLPTLLALAEAHGLDDEE